MLKVKRERFVASPHLVNLKKSGIIEEIQTQVVGLDFIFDLEYKYAALLNVLTSLGAQLTNPSANFRETLVTTLSHGGFGPWFQLG